MATLQVKSRTKGEPPAPAEVKNTLFEPEPMVEEAAPAPKKIGRPKGTADRTAQISTKVKATSYADMKRIAERDRISLAELIERAVARYELHRVERAAELVGGRQEGEDDDALVRRAFALDTW